MSGRQGRARKADGGVGGRPGTGSDANGRGIRERIADDAAAISLDGGRKSKRPKRAAAGTKAAEKADRGGGDGTRKSPPRQPTGADSAAVDSGGGIAGAAAAAGDGGPRRSQRKRTTVADGQGDVAGEGRRPPKRRKAAAKSDKEESITPDLSGLIVEENADEGGVIVGEVSSKSNSKKSGGNINEILLGIDGFVHCSYQLSPEELANMPTKADLDACPAPTTAMVMRARAELAKNNPVLLARISGNPHPPEFSIVRERSSRDVLRLCFSLQHTLGPKERTWSKKKKSALLEARERRSLAGAIGGDVKFLTLQKIKELIEAGNGFRHGLFDVELFASNDPVAVQAFLETPVVPNAEERLCELRAKADKIAMKKSAPGCGTSPFLVHRVNAARNGPDGQGAVMKYMQYRYDLQQTVANGGVGESWNGKKLSDLTQKIEVGDGFLWKGVLWVQKCTEDDYEEETEAGSREKPSKAYKALIKKGLK